MTILMSGNSIGFGEDQKKLCQKMCSVRMLIWSAEDIELFVLQ